jgi:hypothetical protein
VIDVESSFIETIESVNLKLHNISEINKIVLERVLREQFVVLKFSLVRIYPQSHNGAEIETSNRGRKGYDGIAVSYHALVLYNYCYTA